MKNYSPPSSDTLELTDLYLCSFLRTKGYPIIEVKRENRSKVIFVFPLKAEKGILAFHNGESVSALEFSSQIEQTKSLIFDIKSL